MELHDLAKDHLVTTADATLLGMGPADLRRLVRVGAVRRVIRGWYAVRPPGDEPAPWEDPDPYAAERNWHLIRTRALLLSFEGRVAASHQSALVIHRIETWRSELDLVQLCRTTDDHSRHRRGALIHPACGMDPLALPGGWLTVPPAVAVVQVGMRPLRAGQPFPMESLVAADSALHLGVVTREELDEAVALHTGQRGITAVRTLLAHADGRHESVGETRLMHSLRLLGYDIEPQVWVEREGRRFRVDGQVKGIPLYVEFDGMKKYLKRGPLTPEDEVEARRVLAQEKERHDLITSAGQGPAELARFSWSDLDSLPLIRARMAAARDRLRRRAG